MLQMATPFSSGSGSDSTHSQRAVIQCWRSTLFAMLSLSTMKKSAGLVG